MFKNKQLLKEITALVKSAGDSAQPGIEFELVKARNAIEGVLSEYDRMLVSYLKSEHDQTMMSLNGSRIEVY
jgi:hypothetical protein